MQYLVDLDRLKEEEGKEGEVPWSLSLRSATEMWILLCFWCTQMLEGWKKNFSQKLYSSNIQFLFIHATIPHAKQVYQITTARFACEK